MSDKKHIDRLFQEKFKDFDVAPNDNVWENIEARLQEKKKKRRIIPIWWQLGGVAAALVLLFAVGNFVFDTNDHDPIIVETNKIDSTKVEKDNSTITPKSNDDSAVVSNTAEDESGTVEHNSNFESTSNLEQNKNLNQKANTPNTSKNKSLISDKSNREALTQNSKQINQDASKSNSNIKYLNYEKNAVASTDNINNNKSDSNSNELRSKNEIKEILKSGTKNSTNAVAKSDDSTLKNSEINATEKSLEDNSKIFEIIKEEKGQDIEEAIADANTINEKEEESKILRWSIAPNVAPVYFNSLGNGSSIDAQFANNNTTSDINMSYGVKGSYAVNSRLKITAGVNRVNFSNTTNDVIAMNDNSFSSVASAAGRLQNIDLKDGLNNQSLMLLSRPNIDANSVPEAIRTIETGDLEQRFGFIEIPLEVEYRLVDKKLGLNVSSGFSTLLLNDNEIFADINGENTLLGEANNINQTSFSANFGIGVDYSITEKLNINLEPKFKYQINTFNNTSGDFRPFFIGVYTGLSFKF
ncbi:hypothetical protein ACFQ1Q_04595 [Winogradskyella litorisediminis]|uniref:Outer membrane protein beta-barrel domain-containing protein n=1 Tax=Winogradskyella litorisediminis TaxID=1156618 RepID=A0ABW3N7K4_9FLAO